MAGLLAVEVFKLRKRWMPWVLLGIILALLTIIHFSIYAAHQATVLGAPESPAEADLPPNLSEEQRRQLRERMEEAQRQNRQSQAAELRRILTFPNALASAFSVGQSVGGLLLVVLAASVVGAEYAWGTVRTNLIRGPGRVPYLAAKLLLLLLLALVTLVLLFVASVLYTIITSSLVAGGIDWSFLDWGFAGRVLAAFGRTWFVMTLPMLMASLVAVATRSSAAATGVGIGYIFLEAIVVGILGAVSGWGETLRQYTIGYNVTAIMTMNTLGAGEVPLVGLNLILLDEPPGFFRAAGVLLGYALVFLGLAFYLFKKRDVAAA